MSARAPRLGIVLTLLVVAWPALVPATLGSASLRENLTVNPTAVVPVTLAAASGGSTTLGASSTSATTTLVGLPLLSATVNALTVVHGARTWTVSVAFVSATGFGVAETVTVAIGAQVQVVLLGNTATQSSGTAVSLGSSGPDLTILASGANLAGGAAVLTLKIQFFAAGITAPVFVYPYSLHID